MVLLTLAPLLVSIVVFYLILNGNLTYVLHFQLANARHLQEQVIVSDLKARVETAWSIIDHHYAQGLGQDACRQALNALRHNQNNYVWVHQLDENLPDSSIMLVHPERTLIDRAISGLDDLKRMDKIYRNGEILPLSSEQAQALAQNNIIRTFNQICLKEGEGISRYYWPKIANHEAGTIAYRKLACVKYFPQWKWVVGAGEYEDKIDRAVAAQQQAAESNIRQIRLIVIISFLVIGIAVCMVAIYLKNRFSLHLAESEHALLASEMKYRGLHDSILDAVVQINLEGHIIDSNRSFQALLGYDSQELHQMSVHDLSPEKWRQVESKIFDTKARRKGCYDIYEIEFLRKNGTAIPVELRPFVLQDTCRKPIGSWVIVRDISQRKAAEERASRNEQIFQTLIANLPQKVVLKDENSRIVYCNEKYADSLHMPIEDVIGKTDYDLYTAEQAKKHVQSDREAIVSGGTVELFFHHRKDNEEFVARVLKTVVRNELDQASGILCVLEDFTERTKTLEGLKAANRELEETNRQLCEMQTQLVRSEKLASIGQLAAGIAHEINNPMGFVTNNLFSLRKYLAHITDMHRGHESFIDRLDGSASVDTPQEIKDIRAMKEKLKIEYIFEDIPGLFDDSMEGVQQIIKIVKTLRDFSRVDRLEDFAECDLTEGIRSTLIVANNELKYATEVVTEFADVPEVYCNIGQLNQVFLNMLVNAAQAIGEQKRKEKGRIEIRVDADAEFINCRITDDGPGIAPENVSKIFDPFFTTKPVGKGTGLGLNLSYDIIVNKHKGQLLVDSELGKGTQFTIRIPRNLEQLMRGKEETEYGNRKDSPVCR
jgi:PAS domain S-box-containing protein